MKSFSITWTSRNFPVALLILSSLLLDIVGPRILSAQTSDGGDAAYRARNDHAGNLIRLTFSNNGTTGFFKGDQNLAYSGEWPIGSGHLQLGGTSIFLMSELWLLERIDPITGDSVFTIATPAIFSQGWDPNLFSHDSSGRFLGFEPIPGYLNQTQFSRDPRHAVAMSHEPFTWPTRWNGHWNGYLGEDQQSADQESYFVIDDYQFNKKFQGLSLPMPIPSEPQRGGLGLQISVRGLQWENPDVEDCLFWIYDIRNIGQLHLDKSLFGINVSVSSGGTLDGNSTDFSDDDAKYYRSEALTVSYDHDNIGVGGYTPVPWAGFAYLETPGNPYDGIDNDGDANDPTKPGGGMGHIITTDDFIKNYNVGEKIVLIDYGSTTYDRTVTTMPANGISFTTKGTKYEMKPNTPLREIERNGIDDNLNGIIDESDGSTLPDSSHFYLYIRSLYNDRDYLSKDYVNNIGLSNSMIDERQDDGIDNDGDWNPLYDDVGEDGKPGTGDVGEGDGLPTAGKFGMPGEPDIDKNDADESDQIGLTSFKFYIYSSLLYSNDDQMWNYSRPGYFDNSTPTVADYDYVVSSGYFPLQPQTATRASIALLFGMDETDILSNKGKAQTVYNSSFTFSRAPAKPKLNAVAGNHQVFLYWDDEAEKSYDRYLNIYDFEGYKIYKATMPSFGDESKVQIEGVKRYKDPIAVFDKIDSIYGYFPKDFGTGMLFYLGSESGINHYFVDNNVENGVRYYYAVTAYDRGDAAKNVGPMETSAIVNIDQFGVAHTDQNVAEVAPQRLNPVYSPKGYDIVPQKESALPTEAIVGINIVDPNSVVEGEQYKIQFLDRSTDKRDNDLNGLSDTLDKNELVPNLTTCLVLRNVTRAHDDTVWLFENEKVGADLITLQNLYNDADDDPHSFTVIKNGLQVFVKNPVPGVYENPDQGIIGGMKWGTNAFNYFYDLKFSIFNDLAGFLPGTAYPRHYRIVFFNSIVDTSDLVNLPRVTTSGTPLTPIPLPRVPVNFRVFDAKTGARARFGFNDLSDASTHIKAKAGFFSARDRIIFCEKLPQDSTLVTFTLLNSDREDSTFVSRNGRWLGEGDTLFLSTKNELNGSDVYDFTSSLAGKIRPLSFSASTIRLGRVIVGKNRDTVVTLSNRWTQQITISGIASSSPAVTIAPSTMEIGVGASAKTTITFASLSLGETSTNVIVHSNAPTSPDTITVSCEGVLTGVTDALQPPTSYALDQNYPNPFNPSTTIRYSIPARSNVSLEVFNTLGQRVATLAEGELKAGYHQVEWNSNVASGVYFYRIMAFSLDNSGRKYVETKKMIVMK